MMIRRLQRAWHRYCMIQEADRRGWRMFARLWRACADNRPQDEIDRLIHNSNRLYRLGLGQNPWRKYRGY